MRRQEQTPRELLRAEIGERMDGENPEPEKLNNKQHLEFAKAFVTCDNGKRAALEAGFTDRSAQSMASKLLGTPHVRAWIAHLTVLRNIEIQLDKNWVIRRLMREADLLEGSGASQSARVQALSKLGTVAGLWDEDKSDDEKTTVTITKRA